MQKLFTLFIAFLLVSTAIAQETSQQVAVYFDKDKAILSIEAQNTLTSTFQSILDVEEYAVKIEAHTDDDGSLTYNQLLSERRANTVYDFLLLQGMNTDDLQIVAQGETNPAFSNQTETGQQQNRRVDVFFVSKASLQLQAKAEPKIIDFQDLKRLTTTNTEQYFTISTHQEQHIEGRKGTKLTIPSHAFELEDGSEIPTTAKVEIELQEALSLEDMLLNNLSTMSGDKILETGGMISIEASYQGQKLQLKEGKNIEVAVPKNDIAVEKQNDMELFYGVSQENNAMDWKPTNKKVRTTPPHPKVEIDLTELENFEMAKVALPQLTGLRNVTKKPDSPKKPYKPYCPTKPTKNRYQYKPSGWEKLVFSRKKIDQLSEKRYEEALQKYEKRKADYDINMARYEDNLKAYQEAVVKYQELNKQRTNTIIYNIAVIDLYRNVVNDYKEYLKSGLVVNYLKKYIEKNGLRERNPTEIYSVFGLKTKARLNLPIGEDFICKNLGITAKEAKHFCDERNQKYRVDYRKALNEARELTINQDYCKSVEEMLSLLDERYIEKKKGMGLITDAQYFGYFTTSVDELGWINIDRWLKTQGMQEVMVIAEKDKTTRFFAVSHTFNSCFGVLENTKNQLSTVKLPVGEKFTIIGMKIENGKFLMADKSFEVTQTDIKIPMNFEEKTLAQLKQKVRSLEAMRPI
ncbi:MAG: OmpA family protein [Chitinophagales bacterium]